MKFADYYGESAVSALAQFEGRQKGPCGVHTFARMAAIADPQYLQPVLDVLTADHPTAGKVLAEINKAVKVQWYSWHIMSKKTDVHDDRSMPFLVTEHGFIYKTGMWVEQECIVHRTSRATFCGLFVLLVQCFTLLYIQGRSWR